MCRAYELAGLAAGVRAGTGCPRGCAERGLSRTPAPGGLGPPCYHFGGLAIDLARTSSRTLGRGRDVELGVVDDREARAVPARHPAVDAGDLLVGEAAVARALGVALQDDLQARQEDDRQQAGADVPLPAAEADDRAVGEDGVVEDAGDAVGQEVPGGEAAGAAGEAVLRLGVVVPAGLGVGEARADPLAYVVQADVGGGHPAVVRPVLGDAGLAGPGGPDEQHRERGARDVGGAGGGRRAW